MKRPPSFSLILPKELEVEGDKFNFGVFSESKFSQIKKLIVLVNGIPLNGIEGISIESGEDFEKQVSLTLENGKNYFQVYIVDFEGTKSLTKSFVVNSTISKLSKPNLYVVAIGVSDHKSKENSLVYAKKDAIDFLNKMKKNKIYKDVKYKLLFDSAATKRQIETINEFVSPAKESDVFILFYAGHGVLDKELNYYLSTYSIDFTAPQIEGLSIDTLSHIVSQIKCRKKLVFIDACHSGEVDKEDIVINNIQITSENKEVKFRAIGSKGVSSKNLYDSKSSIEIAKLLFTDTRSNNGVNIISSAGGAEYAMEGGEWKNGVFTYALLNGFKTNEADLNKDGEIWVNELQEYLGKKVSLITGGKQTPTSRSENLSSNFRVW
ncbi:MAG: caspase family protein [Bacteroidetes bacterium]|nr:caspase family protein [Bacteroidota bacterium]